MKRTYMKCRATACLSAVAICLCAIGFPARGAVIYQWYSLGPQPINTLDNSKNVVAQDSGRVATVVVDPANANHWLIGAAQGGIWETSDHGATWNPRTDSQASMAMGAIAFAPNNPSLVYAGTGEANFRGDAYAGAGLLSSSDGGTTWSMLNSSFAKTSFSRIRVNSANANNLSVATARGGGGVGEESLGTGNVPGAPPRGVFVSTTGGAGFTQYLNGEATALEANTQNFSEQYAGLGETYGAATNGVYRTTNGWLTSQLIQGPWPSMITNITYISTNIAIATNTVVNCTNGAGGNGSTNILCYTNREVTFTNIILGTNIMISYGIGRISMATAPSDPNTIYVGIAYPRTRYIAGLSGIWMTTNAWAPTPTWTKLPDPPVQEDFTSLPRFWYMFDLLVDPNDRSELYLAEYNVWRYQSGSWTAIEGWSYDYNHPDNHAMAWIPDGGNTYQMLLGNDGGVYVSDLGVSGAWTSLNGQLRITQFYKGSVQAPYFNLMALGGAQDEFTSLYTGSLVWPQVVGGDGGDCAISATDPLNDWAMSADTPSDNIIGFNQASLTRTLVGFDPFGYITAANDINDVLPFSQQFYVHFEKAPFNDDLLIAGTATLWKCTDFFSGVPSWSPNSPTMLDTNGNPVPISAMAFAPSATSGLVYAYGTEDGQLRITSDGGATWQDLDPAGAVPNRYVSGLAFSPTDTNTLYVTLSGFDEGTPGHAGHLFKTSNAFASPPTWSNISPPVDLPNNCLAINPVASGSVYVGTDQGVWNTANGGASWTHFGPGSGMPNVAVYDLRFDPLSRVVAFTHGRGAYILTAINLPILVWLEPNFHPTPNCLQCPPDQLWFNPGDEITLDVPLQNILPVDTVDLKATMLASAQVSPITGTQDYGAVRGQGQSVSRLFQFIAGGAAGGAAGAPGAGGPAGGSCGGAAQVVFDLQDQGVDLGQVSIPFNLGQPSHPLAEDFEEGLPAGMLPPGWTSAASGTGFPWSTTTNPPPNTVDDGEDNPPIPAVQNTSVVVDDFPGVSQSYLTSPPFQVATTQAQLFFRESFAVSNNADGGTLQIAIGAQPFTDIIQAGGSFVKDGYNAVVNNSGPFGSQPGWSGDSGGWLPVTVNLPPSAAGQTVRLRWNFTTSAGMINGAWFLDSVIVTEPLCLPPVSNPIILNPMLKTNSFTFAIDTVLGRSYVIEYKTNLNDTGWQTFETLLGNGSNQTVSVPVSPQRQEFYHFYVQ